MSAQHVPGPWIRTCAGDWRAENDSASFVEWTGIGGADGTIVALEDIEKAGLGGSLSPELCASITMAALDKARGEA